MRIPAKRLNEYRRYLRVSLSNQRLKYGAALIAGLQQHINDDAIVEPNPLIAYQNMSSKFNTALSVPAQGFCATTN